MKKILQKGKLKVLMLMSFVVSMLTTNLAFASEPTDLDAVKTALTTAFTPTEIASVIGIIIGAGVGFVLLWWGARKLVNAIIGAFKTGKLRF
ncbi:MAG: hypothetical protein QXI16_03515 [Sulfolobaceae archaeon]